eukprot:TRINITY_DN90894_c0_g1_i1.p1 TRINITY_DN90894_c0_g1~~TRINITY_DN90894_c0_g1_i1.p1  ORF type:complete len:2039 (+),score=681.28 TRINITY_DN90894_c0_g1_i1:31-6147(+)
MPSWAPQRPAGHRPGGYGGGAGKGSWSSRPQSSGPAARPPSPAGRPPAVAAQQAAAAQKVQQAQAATQAAPADHKYVVSTQSKQDDIGIQTLLGKYAEKGTNHGKKYYQKIDVIPGHEEVKVFMYFWDARDGPDFSGWWFGDEVGGTQVWARNPSQTPEPPRVGWKVPWDSPKAEAGLLFVDIAKASAAPASAAPGNKGSSPATPGGAASGKGPDPAGLAAILKKATQQVDVAEKVASGVVQRAKTLLAGQVKDTELKNLQENLTKQQATLQEAQKSLTGHIGEARKGGVSSTATVTELSKLSTKLRSVQASVATELNKTKSKQPSSNAAAPAAKQETKPAGGFKQVKVESKVVKVEAEAAANKTPGVQQAAPVSSGPPSEEDVSKHLKEFLPEAEEITSGIEESIAAIIEMTDPLVAEPPEDGSEMLRTAFEEVEASTQEAEQRIMDTRKEFTAKTQATRTLPPNARKAVLAGLTSLQNRLNETQKKLVPLKTFRKDFKAKVQARKSLSELTDKLSEVELELEKVAMMSMMAESEQMTEEEVGLAEKALAPASGLLVTSTRNIEQKLGSSQGVLRTELSQLKERALGLKKRSEELSSSLKVQRAGLTTQKLLTEAAEKVALIEEAYVGCQDAEMPFLKGIEVLPADESKAAIAACEAAVSKGEAAAAQTRGFISLKLNELQRQPKGAAITAAIDELKELVAKVDEWSKKFVAFKQGTAERKLTADLADVLEVFYEADVKLQAFGKIAEIMGKDLVKVSTADLKAAAEKVKETDQAASKAVNEASARLASKRKSSSQASAASLQKLQGRLSVANQELTKHRKACIGSEKVVKAKEVLEQEEKRVTEAEGSVEHVENVLAPLSAGGDLPDDTMQEVGADMVNAQKTLKSVAAALQLQLTAAAAVPSLKTALQQLADRTKKAQERLSKGLSASKGQRDRILGQALIQEGTAKAKEVDVALERLNDAELPFLRGLEVLPVEESLAALAAGTKASADVESAVTAARNALASASLEIKSQLATDKAKPLIAELATLTSRINSAASTLSQFRKENDGRQKRAKMQEAEVKIDQLEKAVADLAEESAPLAAKEVEAMDAEQAVPLSEKLSAKVKEVQALVDTTRNFLAARLKDASGVASLTETVKKLQVRLSEANVGLAKSRKSVQAVEQKFAAQKALAEVKEILSDLEAEAKKAEEACAPLLEKGGEEFLVATSQLMLATALREHMAEKTITVERLFAQAGAKEGKLSRSTFIAYLAKLPEAISRPQVAFSEERREAIFSSLAGADKDTLDLASFQALFLQRWTCVASVSLSEGLPVSSKTVRKVEPKEILESVGIPEKEEGTGMTRVEVKALSDGSTGFVTLKGNQGTTFLAQYTPFQAFCAGMDKAVQECADKIRTGVAAVSKKVKSIGAVSGEAQTEAKTELQKLQGKAQMPAAAVELLKKKVVVAKRDFAKAESAEKNAHIIAAEKKEAEELTADAASALAAVEACTAKLESAAEPLLVLKGEEVEKFATPASMQQEVEKLKAAADEQLVTAKEKLKTQQALVVKATSGPKMEAKKELMKLSSRADAAMNKCKTTALAVQKSCQAIVSTRSTQAAQALRAELRSQGLTPEKAFTKLAGKDGKLSEEAFCKHLLGLAIPDFQREHAKLVYRRLETDGLLQRKFSAFVQQYFVVLKGIAVTSEFEVGKAKTVRKVEVDEIVEVLEGPVKDDKLNMTRIRGKSLLDGVEGWITVKGNQGTPYLKETEKPYYTVSGSEEVGLDEGGRTVKPGEVLELLEGPTKTESANPRRARVKTMSDNATGWMTVTNRARVTCAEADEKMYICKSSVAMTNELGIKSDVVCKLSAGDLLVIEEGPTEDSSAGITRIKGSRPGLKDKVGWVTVKGNAGTVYVEPCTKHYAVRQQVPLQKQFSSSSAVVRQLEVGEALEILEGPKEEALPVEVRAKVRATSDGAIGWVPLRGSSVKRWTPAYRCLSAIALHSSRKPPSEESGTIRQVAKDEVLELIDGPVEEAGEMRMKAKAKKDGAIGWVSIVDSKGKKTFVF